MRGQLSLEFLVILLASLAILSIMVPLMQHVKEAGNEALAAANARLILDKLYYSCERVQIIGENETIAIDSLSNFSVKNISGSLVIGLESKNLSRDGFRCYIDAKIAKGKTSIVLSPGS